MTERWRENRGVFLLTVVRTNEPKYSKCFFIHCYFFRYPGISPSEALGSHVVVVLFSFLGRWKKHWASVCCSILPHKSLSISMSLVLHHTHVACCSMLFVRFVVLLFACCYWIGTLFSLEACTCIPCVSCGKYRALHAGHAPHHSIVSVIDVERTRVCQIRRFFALMTCLKTKKSPSPILQHKQRVFFVYVWMAMSMWIVRMSSTLRSIFFWWNL